MNPGGALLTAPLGGSSATAAVGDAFFWIARIALSVAGAAFVCYVLVLVGLVVTGRQLGDRRGPDDAPVTGERSRP